MVEASVRRRVENVLKRSTGAEPGCRRLVQTKRLTLCLIGYCRDLLGPHRWMRSKQEATVPTQRQPIGLGGHMCAQ